MGKISKGIITLTLLTLLLSCNGNDDAFIEGSSSGSTTAAGANNALVSGISVITGANTLSADGISTVLVRATVVDLEGSALQGVSVDFLATLGAPATGTVVTDANGLADFILTAPVASGTAQIVATTGGFSASASIQFLAGNPSAANSSITSSPATLAADGVSVATVTVLLADANGNLVADGTNVTLTATGGSITSINPATTLSGRASFTVLAPTSAVTATVGVSEVPGLTGSIFFGSSATGDPANIEVTVGDDNIFVSEVGKKANTTISIQVVDAAGEAIDETLYGDTSLNNVSLEFLTRPNGGEFLSGTDASGSIVTTQSSSTIEIRTVDGSATLNLQSGTLPGVLEIRVIALLDRDGNALASGQQIVASLPQLVIASGPPHSIILTSPVTNSVENLEGGVYRRIGTAIVNDRYGNAVPDDTSIALGLVDSVIAMGNDGSIAAGSATLTGSGYSTEFQFDDTVNRNNVTRGLQTNDRVLILNGSAANKSRFVSSVASSTTVDTQTNYNANETGLIYAAGASLAGASIAGADATGNLTIGQGITKDGLATFKVTYPANADTILTGCYGYGTISPTFDVTTYSTLDTRYLKEESAQVLVVASATDSGATTVSAAQFCYSYILPEQVDVTPDASSNSATLVGITLEDVNSVPLPFLQVGVGVSITRDDASDFGVTVTTPALTDRFGSTSSIITMTGSAHVAGDSATVQYYYNQGTASVTITAP